MFSDKSFPRFIDAVVPRVSWEVRAVSGYGCRTPLRLGTPCASTSPAALPRLVTRQSESRCTPVASSPTGTPSAAELVNVIALDGPAGTGKSSVSRSTALALGWRFVDTGATYRAATLAVLRAGVDPEDADAVIREVRGAKVGLVTDPQAPTVLLDDEDVSQEIRSVEVTAAVSAVSGVPAVRALLVELQRAAAGRQGAVVEGRDIATVVAPYAVLKVYLDARPEVRARRRAGELASLGPVAGENSVTAVEAALNKRDKRDGQTNKLRASYSAVHLDTSDLTLDQVVAAVVGLARGRGVLPAPSAP